MLTAETLRPYKLLIILRDGMIWPDGYPDESTNAGWVATGKPKLISDPAVPATDAKSAFWMKPEQGKAVRNFGIMAGRRYSCTTSLTSGSPIRTFVTSSALRTQGILRSEPIK